MYNEEYIFVTGMHKSGTTLIQRILDGHSKILSLPFETHFFFLTGKAIDYSNYRLLEEERSIEDIKKEMRNLVLKGSTEKCRFENRPHDFLNIEIFDESMKTDVNSINNLFNQYLKSILLASGFSFTSKKRIVEKSVEHDEFAIEFKKMFPKAKFIRIIRNPYASVVGFRKQLQKKKFPLLSHPIASLKNSVYWLNRNKELLGDDYLILKYEDLVIQPEESINHICNFLNIDFEEILLRPTFNSEPWLGNSSTGKPMESISNENVDRWKSEITRIEKHIISRYFTPFLKEYGYEVNNLVKRRSRFIPNKKEKPIVYILNRLLEYTMLKY